MLALEREKKNITKQKKFFPIHSDQQVWMGWLRTSHLFQRPLDILAGVFLHFYQLILRLVNAAGWKKGKERAAASAVTWCLSLQKCGCSPLSFLGNRWCFMLNIISTASLSVPLTFSTCVKPNQCLMNMLGAVWIKLVPVGTGLQVPSSLLEPCSCKRQEIFTSGIIK